MSRPDIRLVVVSSDDSYKTIWLNNEKIADNQSVYWEEIIQQIESKINSCTSIIKMESHFLQMDDMMCSDIPEDVNTLEELLAWYKEESGGKEMLYSF